MSSEPSTPPPAAPGPVRPGTDARTALRPDVRATVTGGLWAGRRAVNAGVSIPQGPDRLAEAGNLANLRRAGDRLTGGFAGARLPFQDSDVHKWLEAAAWQLGDPATDPGLAAGLRERISDFAALLARAQEESGYLNSFYQVAEPDVPHFSDLRWSHELYTAGHLVQAAVALHRTTGSRELLDVATRFAEHIADTFGPAASGRAVDAVDGHAEIETALVELARETGEARWTELARWFVDRFGNPPGDGPARGIGRPGYFQDHAPLREAPAVTGHAVRQMYLLAGAVDVATETGDAELREAAERLWTDMVTRQTYITGGIGARHADESFGAPYELPADRGYLETCAAIASVQASWRLALLTGEAKYADLIERTLYNAVLCGVSLSGDRYLYDNPLHVRDGWAEQEGAKPRRTPWFHCACCPPNVMRLLASLPHYLAAVSADRSEFSVHQYATGRLAADLAGGPVELSVSTDYPWDGRIRITVERAPSTPWTLALRVPHWSAGEWSVALEGGTAAPDAEARDGWARVTRAWSPGETLVLNLDMAPRFTRADPRVDAVRGTVAIERGPLVYAVEHLDQPGLPPGTGLDDLVVDPSAGLTAVDRPDLLGGVVAVTATARVRPRPAVGAGGGPAWWPYTPASEPRPEPGGEPLTLTAVPYHLWANREDGPMRVWLPAGR